MVGVTKRRKRKTERKEMFRLAEFLFKIFDTLNKNALYSIKTNEEDSFTTTEIVLVFCSFLVVWLKIEKKMLIFI
jgi:lipoprotein signal peptidase